MTPDLNADLLSAYRASPTLANRNRVVVANLGLVEKAANRFSHTSRIPFDDLYSVGCLGLIKAVEGFDLTTGNRFSSYAMPRIRGAMLHWQRDREQPGGVKVPRRWIDNRRKILEGDFSGIRPEDITAATQAVQYCPPASLDAGDDDDSPGIQLASPNQPRPQPMTVEDVILRLNAAVDETQYFNATAICQRYGRSTHHWRQTATAKKLVAAWEGQNRGKPAVTSRRGKGGGCWIHNDLAADFLRWVSPEAAALVCYAYSQAIQERLQP